MTSKLILYYLPFSTHSEKAKEILEKSGLKFEVLVLDSREKLEAIAYDAFMFYGGPSKAPALLDKEKNKFYEGLYEIKKYVLSLKVSN